MKRKSSKTNWDKLKECLEIEVKLTSNSIKKNLATKSYSEVNNMNENLAVVRWVLDEMEAIETTGECL